MTMKEKEHSMSTNVSFDAIAGAPKAVRRRGYDRLCTYPLTVEICNAILTGSIMMKKIKVSDVEVTDYQPGIDNDGQDFSEVTFE